MLQETESCSFNLALLLVRRKLIADLATAPILPSLVDVLQEEEEGEDLLLQVVHQLREAGHHPVAAGIKVGESFLWKASCNSIRCKWRERLLALEAWL